VHGQRKPPPKKVEPPPPIAPLVLSQVLDTYAAGRFDVAVREVAQAGDTIGRNLRAHWSLEGRAWIDAAPAAERPLRLLVAAALVLESETVRVERGDWNFVVGDPPCGGPCALDWAQSLFVERGPADAAEHAWYLAVASLAGGVRDWRYLQRVPPPNPPPNAPPRAGFPAPPPVLPGLTERALLRFPNDPFLRLEQAIAAAGRFSTTVDGGRLTSDPGNIVITMGGPGSGIRSTSALPPREVAANMLDALVADPVVGAEAQMRLGYLRWVLGADQAAKRLLKQAAERSAGNADVQYLARFLLGWIALQAGDADTAVPELEAALRARPDSQSAALALATLDLQRGEAGKAYDTARASLDHRNTDDDPWRLFLYGHHPLLSSRVAALRAEVRK
jgi:tetratricopeptide (TPR) repeat protein